MSRIAIRPTTAGTGLRSFLLSTLLLLLAACGGDAVGGPTPPPPPVAQVIVEPATHALDEGGQHQYSARLFDAAGREVSGRAVSWTTTHAEVATISGQGVLTALLPGTTQVRATSESVTGTGTLIVRSAAVDRVELSAVNVSIEEGESTTLAATAKDAAGRTLEGRTVTWMSDDPSTVTVTQSGTLTGAKPGQTRVVAMIEGRTAAAAVTVRTAAVATVIVSPTGFVIEIGETRQLAAVAKDARGRVLLNRPVAWLVDSDAALISPSGSLLGARNSYITIQALVDGVAGIAVATVVPTDPTGFDLVYHRHLNTGASELFTLTPGSGAPPTRINAGTVSRTPTASPDGSRIAFAVSMDTPGGERVDDIFAVDRTGLNMRRLTTMDGADESPAWSPTAQRIAFRHGDAQRSDIWTMNADGTGQTNLTGDMPSAGYRAEPAWSADGTRIAFSERTNGLLGTMASIWIMNADGSGKHAVIHESTGFDAAPTWSPDGTRLAILRYHAGGEADITIVRIADGALERIALPGLEGKPSWSPDGELIAFSSGTGNDLFTIQPDGRNLRQRTVNPAWGGGLAPSWIRR